MKIVIALLLCLASFAQATIGETYTQSAARYGSKGFGTTTSGMIWWQTTTAFITELFTPEHICYQSIYTLIDPNAEFPQEVADTVMKANASGVWYRVDKGQRWLNQNTGLIAALVFTPRGKDPKVRALVIGSEEQLLEANWILARITQPDPMPIESNPLVGATP